VKPPGNRRRWLMLMVGTLAMIAGSTSQFGIAYLIPAFREQGLSLQEAGVLVACPTAGVMLTLIAWGAAADRWGERVVLSTGLGLAGLFLVAAQWVHGTVALAGCLALSGAAGASVLASGRLILGWFARHERALAMGIRQSAGPMGLALAAATLPALAAGGTSAPLLFLAALLLTAATAALVLIRDPAPRPPTADPSSRPPATDTDVTRPAAGGSLQSPAIGPSATGGPPRPSATGAAPRLPATGAAPQPPTGGAAPQPAATAAGPPRRPVAGGGQEPDPDGGDGGHPYRGPGLWRIHGASALLIVPQYTIATFALVFLTDERGWPPMHAGYAIAGAQVCGALGRLGAGYWSDRSGSRLRPMRTIALTTGAGMLLLAAAAAAGSGLAVPVLLVLAVVAASSNGLSFTAVAERAGTAWAGRALGVQTTGQNIVTAATPPVVALAITGAGFAPSFAVVAAIPIVAAAVVPVAAERAHPP
jgi:MFS family permease